MTSRNYFGKMNSIFGSVVPLAMFLPYLDGDNLMDQLPGCSPLDQSGADCGNLFLMVRGLRSLLKVPEKESISSKELQNLCINTMMVVFLLSYFSFLCLSDSWLDVLSFLLATQALIE